MISNTGQFVKLTKSRLCRGLNAFNVYADFVLPTGITGEVVAIVEDKESNERFFNVDIHGMEPRLILQFSFDEVAEMTLAEIGQSPFFTF